MAKRLTQTDAFELKGEWWRSGGDALLRGFEAAPPRGEMGLDEGFALLQGPRDRLEGIDPEHACRGPLRFDPERGLRLNLLGSSEIAFPANDEWFTVHGRTTEGTPCSLLECLITNVQVNFPSGFADREILSRTLVHGVHVNSADELVLDEAVVQIPGLLEFLWAPVHAADGTATTGLGGDAGEEHTVRLDGAEIVFAVREQAAHTTHTTTRERAALCSIRLDQPAGFDEWKERWVEPLVRLVVFASRRPTRLASISALLRDRPGDGPTEDPSLRRQPVEIVERPRRLRRAAEPRWDRMLLTYAGLGAPEAFDSLIRNWWKVHHGLGGAADFLFGALRDPMSLEPQLVTLASVIEAYHRTFHDAPPFTAEEHDAIVERMLAAIDDPDVRKFHARRLQYANQLPQKDRVVVVLRRAGDVVEALGRKSGRLADAVNATRNYFVHLPSKQPEIINAASLYEANQLMTIAIQCNLLLDLGLSPAQALSGIERSYSGEPVWQNLLRRKSAWPKGPPAGAR